MSKRRLLIVAGGLSLLLLGVAAIFIYLSLSEDSEEKISSIISSSFSEGRCSDGDAAILNNSAAESSGKGEQAKAYESAGICYVYRNDEPKARENYEKAAVLYQELGQVDKAKNLRDLYGANQSTPETEYNLDELRTPEPDESGGIL